MAQTASRAVQGVTEEADGTAQKKPMDRLTSKKLRHIYNQLVETAKPVETVRGIAVFTLRADLNIPARDLAILQEILMCQHERPAGHTFTKLERAK